MKFDSYTDRVVGVAAALVNALTPGEHGGRPVRVDPERAATVLGRPVGPDAPAELTRLAARLRPVFLAAEDGAADRVAELVNTLLADYRSELRLSRHDGEPWHLHFTSAVAGTEWGAACATGLAVVVDGQATGPASGSAGPTAATGCMSTCPATRRAGSAPRRASTGPRSPPSAPAPAPPPSGPACE